jgi:hypothetical protein
MSLMLPEELSSVLNLLGFNWPEADEDKLQEAAQHWWDFASEVGQIKETAHRHASQVVAGNTGASVDAFHQHWQQVEANLGNAQEAAEVVAGVLEAFAAVVVGVKLEVIYQLGLLLAEIGVDTIGAFFTFGATELAAAGEVVITRGIVKVILDRIVEHIVQEVTHRLEGGVLKLFLKILEHAAIGAGGSDRARLRDAGSSHQYLPHPERPQLRRAGCRRRYWRRCWRRPWPHPWRPK